MHLRSTMFFGHNFGPHPPRVSHVQPCRLLAFMSLSSYVFASTWLWCGTARTAMGGVSIGTALAPHPVVPACMFSQFNSVSSCIHALQMHVSSDHHCIWHLQGTCSDTVWRRGCIARQLTQQLASVTDCIACCMHRSYDSALAQHLAVQRI